MCTQNQFAVHLYSKPIYSTAVLKSVDSTGVHKTSLKNRFTQNQFKVQLYIKAVYNIGVLKTRLEYTF